MAEGESEEEGGGKRTWWSKQLPYIATQSEIDRGSGDMGVVTQNNNYLDDDDIVYEASIRL